MDADARSGSHRRALRAAALELHKLSSLVGRSSPESYGSRYPAGFQNAYASRLRTIARACEEAAGHMTVVDAKKALLQLPMTASGEAVAKATAHANASAMGILNTCAARQRVDPFTGMIPEHLKDQESRP